MIDADRFDELAGGLNHPEGVAWDPVGGRVVAGGEGGEIYTVTLDGEVTRWAHRWLDARRDGRRSRSRVRACDEGGEIARWDPVTKEITTYARGVGGGTWLPNVGVRPRRAVRDLSGRWDVRDLADRAGWGPGGALDRRGSRVSQRTLVTRTARR